MNEIPMSRRELQSRIDANWQALLDKLDSFSDDELTIPNVIGIWSMKDLIGHLETWDRIATMKIEYAEQGETRPWWQVVESPYDGIDEFNEADVEANRHKSIEELWHELHSRHTELLKRVERSSAVTNDLIAVDTWEHYLVHLADITEWERQREPAGGPDQD